MNIQSQKKADFIERIAVRLIEIFAKPLHQLSIKKNHFTHVESLNEILEWSREFYYLYYDKIGNWEKFKSSNLNIFNADNMEEFVIAFGHSKFIKFCFENSSSPTFFLEKYAQSIKSYFNNKKIHDAG